MSSTGVIHKTRAATSVHTEKQRQLEHAVGAAPGVGGGAGKGVGTINTLHDEKPRLVKAHDDDGVPLANGNWIELNHSAQEITERWGTVREGFRIRVSFTGAVGTSADGTIIGAENEDALEPHVSNEASVGLWAIFHGHFA